MSDDEFERPFQTGVRDLARTESARRPGLPLIARGAQRRRRRSLVARSGIAVACLAATIGVGLVATSRASDAHRVSTSGLSTSISTTPPTKAMPTMTTTMPRQPPGGCRVEHLRAFGGWQGAGGTMGGAIWLTNSGTSPCSLVGRPGLRLLNARGEPLAVRNGKFEAYKPDAVVTLEPGVERGAIFTVVWENWCGSAAPLTVQLALPHSRSILRVTDEGFESRPRCDNPRAESFISIGHFERSSQ
ncbi:MAG: hypothetical protein QOE62_2246 [Actinomycetota bacterium]|jgi:hypothetical protein|nr:hypothetical protein [Actinomycetota bacterium]